MTTRDDFKNKIRLLGGWCGWGAVISGLCDAGYPEVWGFLGTILCWYGLKKQEASIVYVTAAISAMTLISGHIVLTGWILQAGIAGEIVRGVIQANRRNA